jgi:lipoprotein-anchoring transpeptidase ErfK/SrfK
MTTTSATRARQGTVGGAAIVLSVAALFAGAVGLVLIPAAGAVAPRAAQVEVHGAATLTQLRVPVYAKPSKGSRRLTTLRQFRPDFRPQYVLALSVKRTTSGAPSWYRITYPGRPNGQKGWVRASALEVRPMTKRLVIDRSERRFEFWTGKRLVRAGKVAVGKRGAETPSGLFYVTWKFDPRIDPDWAILGEFAFETSAYSRLTDWPGGGIVGVHGTPWPELLGGAVSHGCVRFHNRDIRFLRSRVPLGMPVKIIP